MTKPHCLLFFIIKGPCSAGFYCLRGAKSPNNAAKDSTSGPCPKAHYCPEGTSFPIGCRSGTYMPVEGESSCFQCLNGYYCPANVSDFTPYPCALGHYCPNGTRYATEFACPKGHYRNQTKGKSVSDCVPCPGGQYCEGTGLDKPSGRCDPGFFCVRMAYSKAPRDYDNFTSNDCLCPSNSTGNSVQNFQVFDATICCFLYPIIHVLLLLL